MDWNKALRKLFLQIDDKFSNKFDRNVSKIIFCNNQLPFFSFHTFFFYKHKAYRSWNLGLTFSISQKLKDLRNIFMYQKKKLVLKKISSIKNNVHPLPPPHPVLLGGGDWTCYQIFKKGGKLDKTSTLRGGLLEKRGVTFLRGIAILQKKNKLKSEIFNDKKKCINKNIFLCHN